MPLVDMWIVRCPRGDCGKKQGVISKKASEDEAREAIVHHLVQSPHHQVPEDKARREVASLQIERWTEEWPEDDVHRSERGLKRALEDGRSQSSGGDATAALLRLSERMPQPDDDIILSRQELLACVDSLRRAKRAAEAAANVAAKASRAFADEARTIQDCMDVITAYAMQ